MSPVNWRPDNPPYPISSPERFSKDLDERLGHFRTLGWAEATWPLNEDRLDEQAFMDDRIRAFDDRAQVILNRLDTHKWDLLIDVLESTDRVQHMMWRFEDKTHPMYSEAAAAKYGDSIERVYRRVDQMVGEVLDRVEPGTQVIVMSDHGFHSFRQAVNLNTWLVQEGFLSIKGARTGQKTLDNLFLGSGQFWENVDWSKTRAYALGLGQVFINVKGREGEGIVNPGDDYTQVVNDLVARLMTLTYPGTGARIVGNVYKRADIYSGEYFNEAPDLQVGMNDGYRVSWQTTLGGSPQGIVYPNMKKWSGDHGGYDFAETAGVLVSNRTLSGGGARIIDIAPTVLKHFGITVPGGIDGRALY